MTTSIPLVLNDDVVIVPVSQLPTEVRGQFECTADDFAVSRREGRDGSTIIDVDAQQLLSRFREPRTVVEAVVLFARAHDREPMSVLEGAYPLLRGMVARRVLVPVREASPPPRESLAVGRSLAPGTIVRVLQRLEDVEVHLLRAPDGSHRVLKIASADPRAAAGAADRLRHESRFLARLDGGIAPRLLETGEIDGRAFLLLEHIPGTDVETVALEWRAAANPDGRAELAALCRRIAEAYSRIHDLGILHGDVHPQNVLVLADGSVRLIDFGLARATDDADDLPSAAQRGGVPWYFDPELARAYVDGTIPAPVTPASEQFSVAALLHLVVTGEPWQRFHLERESMLRQAAERGMPSFSERGFDPWPEVEPVLQRALAREPALRFPNMRELAAAFGRIRTREAASREDSPPPIPSAPADPLLEMAALDGPWIEELPSPPTASITYGAAGIALGWLHVAMQQGDASALATADCWCRRAERDVDRESAFYHAPIEITPDVVGRGSPYHAESGIHAVGALIARARGDHLEQARATARYVETARRPVAGVDLTLGRASTLLGSAILLDALDARVDATELSRFGREAVLQIWERLEREGPIGESEIRTLGIAHGWAGFIYATLHWCGVSGDALPDGIERRLEELARFAVPAGRGLQWPWTLSAESADVVSVAGWCNGSAGHAFMWAEAHRLTGAPRYRDLAVAAAWHVREAHEGEPSLCCGLAGRAYALLRVHRLTGDRLWLERARAVASRADAAGIAREEYPHSLFKGALGASVLRSAIEAASESRMPFFEPLGYRG